MKLLTAPAAAVVLSRGFAPLPAAATHRCGTEEPRCVDRRTLVQKPERQEVTSGVLGHHCYHDSDAGQPNRDRRVLLSRIGVVFSSVTGKSGYLESVTIHFEGEERQVMGSVDAIGKRNDFHRYNDEPRSPGSRVTLRVGKQVEFNALKGGKNLAVYNIRHEPAAGRPGASGPGGHPGGPARPGLSADCKQPHHLILEVTPQSPPPCRNKPPQPCPPG